MKFSHIVVGLWSGLVASSCTRDTCCSLSQLGTKSDFLKNMYTDSLDCRVAATTSEQLAMCLVQRNSLQNLLNCAYWDDDEVFTMNVSRGGLLDKSPGLNQDMYYSPNDGKLRFTPRELLTTIAISKECRHTGLATIFRKCPYKNLQHFTACLCCEMIEDEDIEILHKCISDYSPRYAVIKALSVGAEWNCGTWCNFPHAVKTKCPAGSRLSSKDDTVCQQPVRNGKPVPLGLLQGRAGTADYAKFSTWYMTSSPTARTRTTRTGTGYPVPTVASTVANAYQTTDGTPTAFLAKETYKVPTTTTSAGPQTTSNGPQMPGAPASAPSQGGGDSGGNKSDASSGHVAASFTFLFSALCLMGIAQHVEF